MDDLVTFLRARLDEDEETARVTTPVPVAGEWSAVRDKHAHDTGPLSVVQGQDEYESGYEGYSYGVPIIAIAAEWHDQAEANVRHIARHNPARVLREVEAKRRIVDEYAWLREHGDAVDAAWVLVLLAAVYADHPDYRPEWVPGEAS